MSEARYVLGIVRRMLTPQFVISRQRILKLKDKYRGRRAFILGNGPSLKKMDLSLLRHEITFGLNRIYLLFDELGFSTSYFVAVNRYVLEQSAKEIVDQVKCPKFIDWDARHLIPFAPNMMFLKTYHENPCFFTDISRGIWQGTTVTYVAMQIAYYMGFDQVVLIGVDHSFVTEGKPHQVVVTEAEDPNHFDPQYFGKGYRWQLPDLCTSELAYRLAKYQFENVGREIVDATVDGKLDIFRKVDYSRLFVHRPADS